MPILHQKYISKLRALVHFLGICLEKNSFELIKVTNFAL